MGGMPVLRGSTTPLVNIAAAGACLQSILQLPIGVELIELHQISTNRRTSRTRSTQPLDFYSTHSNGEVLEWIKHVASMDSYLKTQEETFDLPIS